MFHRHLRRAPHLLVVVFQIEASGERDGGAGAGESGGVGGDGDASRRWWWWWWWVEVEDRVVVVVEPEDPAPAKRGTLEKWNFVNSRRLSKTFVPPGEARITLPIGSELDLPITFTKKLER